MCYPVGVARGQKRPQWQVAAQARRSVRLRTDPEYRVRIRKQQQASEQRRRQRVKSDPEYRERFLAGRRQQAMLRMEKLRGDPAALTAYRKHRKKSEDPEKRRRNAALAQARRRDRLK